MNDNDLNIILDDIKVEVNEENNEPILCESCTKLFDSERKLAFQTRCNQRNMV